MEEEFFGFELDKDQIDALRLEIQSVSPENQARLEKTVLELNRRLCSTLGENLEKPFSDSEVLSKIIVVERETFKQFKKDWLNREKGSLVQTHQGEEHAVAEAFSDTGNLAIVIPEDLWSTLDDEKKQKFISQAGNTEEAEMLVNGANSEQTLLHELTH